MRLALILLAALATSAHAAHPRIVLDAKLRAEWKRQSTLAHGPVVGAIALCEDARTTHEHDKAVYQGSEWSKVLQACLVAWAATDKADDAKTAIRFMTALLDDLDDLGDHKGGDEAARRDSGYAIRNLGPYPAIAYDWLYDQLPAELRERAPKRFAAWLDWFLAKGYRARNPGSNYQAGYLLTATLAAIATDDPKLKTFVADELWGKDMAAALAPKGILDGGDWPEGWQYGPLSVAEYALAMRAARGAGIAVPGAEAWLHALLQHHVYALSPADGVYPSGDAEDAPPNLPPSVLTLDAIALGDATPDDRKYALGELNRLKLADRDYLLYDALAVIGPHATVPRETWPTWYEAPGTSTVFARTRWDDQAIWFVMQCSRALETDHRHPDAGNFVLSRGRDDVIVDPSPYGSQSTLTSNAPTVASAHLPEDYIPSQAFWGKQTSWDFKTQTKSGVIAGRCDYSDQFVMQEQKTDVPDALRDLIVVPFDDGKDATVIVIDRATTTSAKRKMVLNFHAPGGIGTNGAATVGGSRLQIIAVGAPGAVSYIRSTERDCFKGQKRGSCDASRFDSTSYRAVIDGPRAEAIHVLAVTGGTNVTAVPLAGAHGVVVTGGRDATVAWPDKPNTGFSYTAPKGLQIILDEKNVTITATPDGDRCKVEVAKGGDATARPAIIVLDATCAIVADTPAASAASAAGTAPTRIAHAPRSGCCAAEAAPGSSFVMAGAVTLFIRRRKKRPCAPVTPTL